MPVWADDAGLVHLWAVQADSPKGFLLECDESGGMAQYPFDVADPGTFSPATPRVLPTGRKELPALSDAPMSLSQAELLEAGYPPRPDPAAAPEAYGKWLEVVSEPMTFVEPHLVERTDVHFGPISFATSANWSGSILQDGTPRYVWALGTIPVTAFTNPAGLTSSQIAPWVGLNGWGTSDVVQDGFFYQNVGGVATYTAWYEYFPDPPVFNTTMAVSPGNAMTFWAWEGNAACQTGGSNSGFGCFWYRNDTTGVTAGTFTVAKPVAAPAFTGATAEAIYERVSSGTFPSGAPLSFFSPSPWIEYAAFDASLNLHGQPGDPYTLSRIVNGSGQTLVSSITAGALGGTDTIRVNFIWSQAQ